MSPPIRVAHVVATVGATGVEAFLLTLLPSLGAQGVSPTLFVPGEGPLTEKLRARGVDVEHGAPSRKLDLGAGSRLSSLWRGRFDLVHAHGPRASFWAEPAARHAGLPCVITVHELRWQTLPPGWRRAAWVWLESRALRRAGGLTTVSEATRRDLVAHDPTLASRLRVVHAATPLALDGGPALLATPFPGGRPLRLITVGRFSWQKGYDLLFEALALVARSGVDFTLEIVGHGPGETGLRTQAERLGIADRLVWLGRDPDLAARLAGVDAFVTTTRAEMFGIAVLEAMLVGVPVLATGVGSIPEVMADHESGELVPFEPATTLPARFAEALAGWIADPARARRYGAAGARRARERFSPQTLARNMAGVYRELLGARDGPPRARPLSSDTMSPTGSPPRPPAHEGESIQRSVRSFYEQVGWNADERGTYEDAARFEDLRPVGKRYLERCHARVKRHLPGQGRYLLDVASGPVQRDEFLEYSAGHRFRVCVDLTMSALRGARRRLGVHGLYVVGDVTRMPFRDGTFDGAVSLHTIYHVPAALQAGAFLELYRVVRPGAAGVVVYSWGKHAPLMFLFDAVPHKVASIWRGLRRVVGVATGETGLYFAPQSPAWFRREVAARIPAEITVWRCLSPFFQRRFVPGNRLGVWFLDVVYALEERWPHVFGLLGNYPMLVLRKPVPATGPSGGHDRPLAAAGPSSEPGPAPRVTPAGRSRVP
ncbi:MAG: glycosyltransferase [Candidatus Eisenbacteria bacterium]